MTEYVQPRLLAAEPAKFPEKFIAPYISTWVEYFRTHAREVIALVRIYNSFRDEAGRPNPAFDVRADEVTAVEQVLDARAGEGPCGSLLRPGHGSEPQGCPGRPAHPVRGRP